ncbi:MAG: sigma-70 family RNA polymerase sigma factor [Desulfococcaceae bacterium]
MTDSPEDRPPMDDPEDWVDQYGDLLYRFALSRVGAAHVAEDLVQETFVAALHGLGSFHGRSSIRTWLMAILKHKIVDHFRQDGRETPVEDAGLVADVSEELFNHRGHWNAKPPRWHTDPSQVHEQKEFLDVLYRCLSEIPSRQADAFLMREVDGRTTEEICKELGISSSNCWVMLYRARMGLRKCLEIRWVAAGAA